MNGDPHIPAGYEDDDALAAGLANGTLERDERLRDALRSLRAHDGTFVLPSEEPALTFGLPSLVDQGSFAGEASILIGIDGIVRADERVEALERRVTALEGGVARGVREALRTRRRLARR